MQGSGWIFLRERRAKFFMGFVAVKIARFLSIFRQKLLKMTGFRHLTI
jgi:hypothetical protein